MDLAKTTEKRLIYFKRNIFQHNLNHRHDFRLQLETTIGQKQLLIAHNSYSVKTDYVNIYLNYKLLIYKYLCSRLIRLFRLLLVIQLYNY